MTIPTEDTSPQLRLHLAPITMLNAFGITAARARGRPDLPSIRQLTVIMMMLAATYEIVQQVDCLKLKGQLAGKGVLCKRNCLKTKINDNNLSPPQAKLASRRQDYGDSPYAASEKLLTLPRTAAISQHGSPIRHILPNGPPPFRPANILMGETTSKLLRIIKQTRVFKQMYKSKVYYLFLDVLEQLGALVDKIASNKIQLTGTKVAAIQAAVNKLIANSGQKLKLHWPLVMLNPHFLKEILGNPTFLVMLFHSIEMAYMSSPTAFWLKPLVKLVRPPTPEKEEQVWWRRKRIYDSLNGLGTSEMQPNLRTQHFRNPGRQLTLAIPDVVSAIRRFVGIAPPQTAHYHHPAEPAYLEQAPAGAVPMRDLSHEDSSPVTMMSSNAYQNADFMTHTQEDAFLSNQAAAAQPPAPPSYQYQDEERPTGEVAVAAAAAGGSANNHDHLSSLMIGSYPGQEKDRDPMDPLKSGEYSMMSSDWLNPLVPQSDLMSQAEFESLDQHEKDRVFREFHGHMQESNFINDLIRKQDEYVNSIIKSSTSGDDPGDNGKLQNRRYLQN